MKTVLLLGATGVFGRRLANNLTRVPGISIVLASRQLTKATALMNQLIINHPHREFKACAVERSALAETLKQLKPWLVIDASGPFQGMDYAVPLLALAAGSNFIDLADARDYLKGFSPALDVTAKALGLVARSGVSSSPTLSTAVVAELTKGWQRIDTIDMAITPDGQGDVGEAVVLGVLSCAGHKIPQFRFGALRYVRGWLDGRDMAIPNVGSRRLAAVDTIEGDIMPRTFNVHSRVAFYAGLESRLEMAGIALLACFRKVGLLKDLSRLVKPFAMGRKFTRLFAGEKGGMLVRVSGINADSIWTQADWSLLAVQGQGLNVPGLPVVAAIRMLLDNQLSPGARIANSEIPLELIEAEFKSHPITTVRQTSTRDHTIFEEALTAQELAALPKVIADFHRGTLSPIWEGVAEIRRAQGFISRLLGRVIGLPDAAQSATVQVSVEREADGTERWTRIFNGKEFHSTMNRGPDNTFWERFGLLNFKLKLREENGKLIYPVTKARFCGLPLSRLLLPQTKAFETIDAQGRFVFDVLITLPIGGLLVHYSGWLVPKDR
jgi:saccharopine dehydrogenase-like NADP-dependent oxidoreductase